MRNLHMKQAASQGNKNNFIKSALEQVNHLYVYVYVCVCPRRHDQLLTLSGVDSVHLTVCLASHWAGQTI